MKHLNLLVTIFLSCFCGVQAQALETGKTYVIKNTSQHTDCVVTYDASKAKTTYQICLVAQETSNDNQLWQLESTGTDGKYYIKTYTGKYLTTDGNYTATVSDTKDESATDSKNRVTVTENASNSGYTIAFEYGNNQSGTFYLGADGNNQGCWTNKSSGSIYWTFTEATPVQTLKEDLNESKVYRIKNSQTGLYLRQVPSGSNWLQYETLALDDANAEYQLWTIEKAYDDVIYIRSYANQKYLVTNTNEGKADKKDYPRAGEISLSDRQTSGSNTGYCDGYLIQFLCGEKASTGDNCLGTDLGKTATTGVYCYTNKKMDSSKSVNSVTVYNANLWTFEEVTPSTTKSYAKYSFPKLDEGYYAIRMSGTDDTKKYLTVREENTSYVESEANVTTTYKIGKMSASEVKAADANKAYHWQYKMTYANDNKLPSQGVRFLCDGLGNNAYMWYEGFVRTDQDAGNNNLFYVMKRVSADGTSGMAIVRDNNFRFWYPTRDIVWKSDGTTNNYYHYVPAGTSIGDDSFTIFLDSNTRLWNTYDATSENSFTAKTETVGLACLKRSLTAGQWSSIILPYDLSATQITSTFGNDTKVASLSSCSGNTISFSSVTDMKANTPYLIKIGTANESNEYIAEMVSEQTTAGTLATTVDNASMTGTYSNISSVDQGKYIINGGKLYLVDSENVGMKPFRAYLSVPNDNQAKMMDFSIDGEVTGIVAIDADGNAEAVSDIFTLDGRLVRHNAKSLDGLAKGLYIVNGKKTMVK